MFCVCFLCIDDGLFLWHFVFFSLKNWFVAVPRLTHLNRPASLEKSHQATVKRSHRWSSTIAVPFLLKHFLDLEWSSGFIWSLIYNTCWRFCECSSHSWDMLPLWMHENEPANYKLMRLVGKLPKLKLNPFPEETHLFLRECVIGAGENTNHRNFAAVTEDSRGFSFFDCSDCLWL